MYNLYNPAALRPIVLEGATIYLKSLSYKMKNAFRVKLDEIRETNKDKTPDEISNLITIELQNALVDHIEKDNVSYSLIEYLDLLECYSHIQNVLSFLMYHSFGLTIDEIKNSKSSLDISTPEPASVDAEKNVKQDIKPV